MNRLLSRSSNISLLHRQIIQRRIIRELSIGTSLCWRGGNEDKKQYGRAPVSWFNVMPMAVAQDLENVNKDPNVKWRVAFKFLFCVVVLCIIGFIRNKDGMRGSSTYNPYYSQPEKINPYSKQPNQNHKLMLQSFNITLLSANAQGATRLSDMQAYELWKLEQDAKLIIKEMNKVQTETETKPPQPDTESDS